METLSFLKYWKGSGGGGSCSAAAETTTVVAARAVEHDDDDSNDDGPFFDLEFTASVPDEPGAGDGGELIDVYSGEEVSEEEEYEKVVDYLSSRSGCDDSVKDQNHSLHDLSPPISEQSVSRVDVVSEASVSKHQFPISLLKPATKLRVFMLRFKKSKPKPQLQKSKESSEASVSEANSSPQKQDQEGENKFFLVNLKVEEEPEKQDEEACSEERHFSKDALIQKYMKVIKPLYIRASKRYSEKIKLSGMLKLGSGLNLKCGTAPPVMNTDNDLPPANPPSMKSETIHEALPSGNVINLRNIPAGFRVVCKRLVKSRSASSMAGATPTPAIHAVPSKRRDDSLLELHDGIQSAILHCKRSFNGSSDSEKTSVSRSSSDEKSTDSSGKSSSGKGSVD